MARDMLACHAVTEWTEVKPTITWIAADCVLPWWARISVCRPAAHDVDGRVWKDFSEFANLSEGEFNMECCLCPVCLIPLGIVRIARPDK